MKLLEKFVLIIYSLLMLIISAVVCLLIFGIIDTNTISGWIDFVLEDTSLIIIAFSVAVLFILLSVRCIFFRKRKQVKKSNEEDILLENEAGRLLISKRAIENCVKNVITQTVQTNPEIKVTVDIDPATNISTYISIILDKGTQVRDFTVGLQEKIKSKIKEDFDLEVKQVNIKIDSAEKFDVKKEIQKNEDKKQSLNDSNSSIIEVQSENNQDLNENDNN